MQLSRRGFLTGRRVSDPWGQLLERLRALAPGRVWEKAAAVSTGAGVRPNAGPQKDPTPDVRPARMAYVRPEALDAVPLVCALAREHNAPLLLAVGSTGLSHDGVWQDSVVLDINELANCAVVQDRPQTWLAEPGCRLGDLAAAGLKQFESAPPERTLAHWAAAPWTHRPRSSSGVQAVDVLFDDGTVETLGMFGTASTRPLRSARVQRLVPTLFQLAQQGGAAASHPLDGLGQTAGTDINLAHLLLGHAGYLALPLRWLLVAGTSPHAPAALGECDSGLDVAVRHAFDPEGRFDGIAG